MANYIFNWVNCRFVDYEYYQFKKNKFNNCQKDDTDIRRKLDELEMNTKKILKGKV